MKTWRDWSATALAVLLLGGVLAGAGSYGIWTHKWHGDGFVYQNDILLAQVEEVLSNLDWVHREMVLHAIDAALAESRGEEYMPAAAELEVNVRWVLDDFNGIAEACREAKAAALRAGVPGDIPGARREAEFIERLSYEFASYSSLARQYFEAAETDVSAMGKALIELGRHAEFRLWPALEEYRRASEPAPAGQFSPPPGAHADPGAPSAAKVRGTVEGVLFGGALLIGGLAAGAELWRRRAEAEGSD